MILKQVVPITSEQTLWRLEFGSDANMALCLN
jgi:hypothetical protein